MTIENKTSIDIIGVFNGAIMKKYVNDHEGKEIVIYQLVTRMQDPFKRSEYERVTTDYIVGNKKLASTLVKGKGLELRHSKTQSFQLDNKKHPLTQLVEFHLEEVRKEKERLYKSQN